MQVVCDAISQEPSYKICSCLVRNRERESHIFLTTGMSLISLGIPDHPPCVLSSRLNGPCSAFGAVWFWWSTVTLDRYHVEYLVPSIAVASDELDTSWMPIAEAGLFGSDFTGMIFQESNRSVNGSVGIWLIYPSLTN